MAEEIDLEDVENFELSRFRLVTVTLNLDRVIRHATEHHSSTYTFTTNFIWNRSKNLLVDVRTYGRTSRVETGFIR